jgi:hypothetical protein
MCQPSELTTLPFEQARDIVHIAMESKVPEDCAGKKTEDIAPEPRRTSSAPSMEYSEWVATSAIGAEILKRQAEFINGRLGAEPRDTTGPSARV